MRESSISTPPNAENAVADEAAWHAPTLRELAQLGMRMARAVTAGAEARAQAGEATAADEAASALALQRAARMVRLTVALDMRRLEPPAPAISPKDQQRDIEAAEAARAEAAADAAKVRVNLWRLAGQPLVRNTIALAIETEAEAPERERLLADLSEKLDEREAYLSEWGPGAYGDIIIDLLAGLGLTGKTVNPYYPEMTAARARAARETGQAPTGATRRPTMTQAQAPP